MIAFLQLIVITIIAAAFARRVMGKRAPEYWGRGERLVFEAAIGLGVLGLLIFGLGMLKLFYAPVFIGLIVVMAVVAWRALSGVIKDLIGCIRSIKWGIGNVALASVLGITAVLVLIRSLASPIADDWDSLAYHLAIPKLYLGHHGIYYIQFSSHSNFPFTWEMLYTLGMGFGSVALAKLFHFVAGVLLVAGVGLAAKRHFSSRAGAIAALIMAGIPILTWEATTAYVDLATALYSFLVIYALMNYSDTGDRKWAVLAGVMAGIAAGTKMTSLALLGIAFVWVLWPSKQPGKQRILTAVGVGLIGALIALPWYLKTFIWTGNPVYPFFFGTFGGKDWTAEAAKIYRDDQVLFGLGTGLKELLELPLNLTTRYARFADYGARLPRSFNEMQIFAGNSFVTLSASIGYVFLLATPIGIASAFKRGKHRPLLAVSLVMVVMWFFMMQNTRYLIPALSVFTLAAVGSLEVFKDKRLVTLALTVVLGGTAVATSLSTLVLLGQFSLPAVAVVTGSESESDYLGKNLDIYGASQYINENASSDAKVALYADTRGFYLDRGYIWADAGNNPSIPYDKMGRDSAKLIAWLKSQGIEYVIVNHGNFPDVESPTAPDYAVMVSKAIVAGLESVYSSSENDRAVVVYRVK